MKKTVRILLILLLIICIIMLGATFAVQSIKDKQEAAESDFSDYKEKLTYDAIISDNTADEGKEDDDINNTQNPLLYLQNINPDVCAWVKIDNTTIDHPIVIGEDNDYYLKHGMMHEETRVGVPFLDYRNNRYFTDFNSVVYGHHIKNHRMFTDLEYFKDKEFYDKNRTYTLILPDGEHTVEIVACLLVLNDDEIYNTVFLTESELSGWYMHMKKSALYLSTDEELDKMVEDYKLLGENDLRFITLSTCSYEYKNARTVIVGKIN